MYVIQHCFICRPSDSTVWEDAGIEPRTFATFALTARRSNYTARSHPIKKIRHIYALFLFRPFYWYQRRQRGICGLCLWEDYDNCLLLAFEEKSIIKQAMSVCH
jgi:hypothetical protein